MNKTRISILLLLLGCSCLFAQDVEHQLSVDSAAIRYLQMSNSQLALYYGRVQERQPRASNHPYFVDRRFTKARLSYRKVIYPEALLQLDLSRDELITISPEFRNLVLPPENVDFVELHGKRIIYFSRDNLPGCPSSGYYIQLYSGNCKVLEKQTAVYMLNNTSTYEFYYSFSTKYYLYKDGVYYNIRNEWRLLKALSPYRKELRRFISANHLQFRQNTEEFLIRTVSEYEKIAGSL